MDEGDRVRVAQLLDELPETMRDDYMVSLVADYHGRIVSVLRGWLGHPRGHIARLHVEWDPQLASYRERYQGSLWLLRAFEGLLTTIGAQGWTIMTDEHNRVMRRFLTRIGATAIEGHKIFFVREWR